MKREKVSNLDFIVHFNSQQHIMRLNWFDKFSSTKTTSDLYIKKVLNHAHFDFENIYIDTVSAFILKFYSSV